MSISRKNAEGYPDPTAYGALTAVQREERRGCRPPRTMIYICSPFKGDAESNVSNALRYCRFAVERGYLPIAPHCYLPRFMDDGVPAERELALSFGLRLLNGCQELWAFGDHISEGMSREIDAARRQCMKIRRFTADCQEASPK